MRKKNFLGFEFKQMSNFIRRNMKAKLSESGFDEVTIMHGWIMGYLYINQDEDIYQKDIETKFEISRSTVTNILQLMEKKGYLTRTTGSHDARLKKIELTELGIKTHLDTVAVMDSFHEAMESNVTEEERETFLRVIAKMKDNVNRFMGNSYKEEE